MAKPVAGSGELCWDIGVEVASISLILSDDIVILIAQKNGDKVLENYLL